MLFFSTKDNVFSWWVGKAIPKIHLDNLTAIQADGDELDYILGHVKGIPFSSAKVQVWRDCFAIFIAENLFDVHYSIDLHGTQKV